MLRNILLVGAGSFLGGSARFILSLLIRTAGKGFPWATFTVNILGSLLIGFLWGLTARNANVPSWLSLFLMVGFCGGFTTFSTFSKESMALLQVGSYVTFLFYAIGSVVIGLLCVWLGYISVK